MGKSPTAIDLFSGCGGTTVGLKQAGFDVIAAVDNDRDAVATYEANHPDVVVFARNIKHLSGPELLRRTSLAPGQLGLLAGCPPCQGFSSMRTLNNSKSVTDPRNDLVFDFVRLATRLLPKTLLFENVPGLACDKRMVWFKARLLRLRYQFVEAVVDASDFKVPQRRRRFLLIAARRGTPAFPAPVPNPPTVRDHV